jgi:hypothetical protein
METELSNEIGIEEIKDGVAILKNGSMISVLEVAPIGFDSMAEAKKKKVVKAYKEWLDSLDYPVQIVVRSVNADINEQISVLKNNVEYTIKQKIEFRELLKEYKEFETWLDNHLNGKTKKSTVYYLVIPYLPNVKKSWSSFFSKAKKTEETEKSIAMLNKRVAESKELLEKTGVKMHLVQNEQLKNLYISYFLIVNKTGTGDKLAYSSPGSWFDEFKKEANI